MVLFKVWSTKYCLTEGIKECMVGTTHTPTMVTVAATEGAFPWCLHGEGKEWHRTYEGAVIRAEEVKLKKLASLNKSIDKINKINFEGVWNGNAI